MAVLYPFVGILTSGFHNIDSRMFALAKSKKTIVLKMISLYTGPRNRLYSYTTQGKAWSGAEKKGKKMSLTT